MRQLGEGGKELAAGAGAEAVRAAGAVDAGVRDRAWAEFAGAGAGTGVRVGAEEAAGTGASVEAEEKLVLDPEETLLWACTDGPLGNTVDRDWKLNSLPSSSKMLLANFYSILDWKDMLCIQVLFYNL